MDFNFSGSKEKRGPDKVSGLLRKDSLLIQLGNLEQLYLIPAADDTVTKNREILDIEEKWRALVTGMFIMIFAGFEKVGLRCGVPQITFCKPARFRLSDVLEEAA